jgi:plasmid stabilization system protein ParE
MAYEVVLSEVAHQDRTEILQYWINRNKSNRYSLKLDALFRAAFNLISIHPNLGRKLGIKKFRVWIARDYLIVYYVDENVVNIVAIWDGRRNPVDLKNRLQQ